VKLAFHRNFDKEFARLSGAKKERVKKAIELYLQEPEHPVLRNHPLKGGWSHYRSISAGGDLRIHYRLLDQDTTLLVAVGTHSQLYK
jgi:addiction module RelE/StbE family toxin